MTHIIHQYTSSIWNLFIPVLILLMFWLTVWYYSVYKPYRAARRRERVLDMILTPKSIRGRRKVSKSWKAWRVLFALVTLLMMVSAGPIPGKVTCVKKGMVKIRFGHGYILWAVNTGNNCKGDRVFVIVKK
jgi:hypothetical protein